LVQRGYRVGLLDADVHGPNVPLMLGVRRRTDVGGWQAIVPVGFASEQIAAQRLPALRTPRFKDHVDRLLVGEIKRRWSTTPRWSGCWSVSS
jgi:Mrp family chromosome partitioning ATPase